MTNLQTVDATSEVLNFLTSRPSLEEIIQFRPSAAAQTRLGQLLEQNREGSLNDQERAELEEFSRVDHFVTLLKIHALRRLQERNTNSA